ncbi:signal peptide peptidase SppA [Aurantiacibacter luteus]|uniref:Serine protease n=1 Tax=Aurantiacibacter luteus TaxID=1581420 RepID=A0A0G9MP85_9SPHN|nr:signal peptide peptidase SppA [Aurantiacibacter luteus]KLE32404.1 serine protease [Aurantiacibacter luteus]
MGFARKVWRLLVGIKDGLALVFLLLFFFALFSILSARPNPGVVREGALLLDLDGTIVEEVAPIDPISALLASSLPTREYASRDLVRAIDAAAGDERIEALALDLSGFLGGGAVHMDEVASALERFKTAGKPIYTYAVAYTDDSLLLAAHASEAWVDPLGGAVVTGPGGHSLYFGGLLDRYNVTANVFRVGTYKSAVEPYTESGMSEPARENASQLVSTLWQEWRANLRRARPDANIELVTNDVEGWLAGSENDLARAALAAGLVDRIGTRIEWGEAIATVVGEDTWTKDPGTFASTDFDPWIADLDAGLDLGDGGKIGVVTIAGTISDGEAGPGSAGAERIAGLLDDALDDDLKALVVRVDSPGGTVTGSETIRRAILRHKDAGIPVVVSMGNYAASGGYWVATPAERIFAEPETLTGSIGVFGVFPSFEGLLADYGVTSDGVRATPLAGQPDLLGGLTPEVRSLLQSGVEGSYARFLSLVAESRGITVARADELGQGRVWDGGAARQLGLVDQFGDLDAAIAWAARRADLGDDFEVDYLGDDADPYGSLFARMMASDAETGAARGNDVFAAFARAQQGQLAQAVGELEGLMQVEGVQARCLECAMMPGAAVRGERPAQGSMLRWLRTLLAD